VKATAATLIGTGKRKIKTTKCGKRMAQAESIPSIAPEAPTIGIAGRKPTATSSR